MSYVIAFQKFSQKKHPMKLYIKNIPMERRALAYNFIVFVKKRKRHKTQKPWNTQAPFSFFKGNYPAKPECLSWNL